VNEGECSYKGLLLDASFDAAPHVDHAEVPLSVSGTLSLTSSRKKSRKQTSKKPSQLFGPASRLLLAQISKKAWACNPPCAHAKVRPLAFNEEN
jgi:hypothetical protein